jgi:hypothetical protein
VSAAVAAPRAKRLALALAASCMLALPAAAQDDGTKVVGTMNGQPITERDLDMTFTTCRTSSARCRPQADRQAALSAR